MHYVYRFLNKMDETIYIGITGNLNNRIKAQHFGGLGHLPDKCYEEAYMVLYSQCLSEDDAKIKERYLINKMSPKYNVKLNNSSQFSFEIKDWNWQYIPIDKNNLKKGVGSKKKPFVNVNLEYEYKEYKSLRNPNKLRLVKLVPCLATVLAEKKRKYRTPAKLSILSINEKYYVFSKQIVNLIDGMSGKGSIVGTIRLINKGVIESESVLLVNDKKLNSQNIISNTINNDGRYSYPNTAVLLTVGPMLKVLELIKEEVLIKYVKQIEFKGYTEFDGYQGSMHEQENRFFTIQEFIDFVIKYKTRIGETLETISWIEKNLSSYS